MITIDFPNSIHPAEVFFLDQGKKPKRNIKNPKRQNKKSNDEHAADRYRGDQRKETEIAVGIQNLVVSIDGLIEHMRCKKIKEGVIIIGNESKGVSPRLLEMANVKLTIKRKGKAESLNAAVAAGIMLSHLTSQ